MSDDKIANNGRQMNNLYSKLEIGGLNYIKHQRRYLILSIIIPIISIIVQIINILIPLTYLLRAGDLEKPPFPGSSGGRPGGMIPLFDAISPIIVLFVFLIFALIYSYYLLRWRNKVNLYESQHAAFQSQDAYNENEPTDENITLTQLFYDIIETMEKIKKVFLGLNIAFVFYLQWFFRYFIAEIIIFFRIFTDWYFRPLNVIVPTVNLSFQILVLIYIFISWRHFRRWNNKLSKIKENNQ